MNLSSLRRIRSSRANGKLSTGPASPEGKVCSSQNAVRHGLTAKYVVLDNESGPGYEALLAQYLQRFGPVDAIEFGMLEEMVAAWWRIRRAWSIETGLMEKNLENQPLGGKEADRVAAAFSQAAATPELGLLHRYETRLHRIYQRALHNFLLLREVAVPNEPSPIFEHPEPLEVLPAPHPDR
jgi:hypothetical protein